MTDQPTSLFGQIAIAISHLRSPIENSMHPDQRGALDQAVVALREADSALESYIAHRVAVAIEGARLDRIDDDADRPDRSVVLSVPESWGADEIAAFRDWFERASLSGAAFVAVDGEAAPGALAGRVEALEKWRETTDLEQQQRRDPFDHDGDGKPGGSLPGGWDVEDDPEVGVILRVPFSWFVEGHPDATWEKAAAGDVAMAVLATASPDLIERAAIVTVWNDTGGDPSAVITLKDRDGDPSRLTRATGAGGAESGVSDAESADNKRPGKPSKAKPADKAEAEA